VLTPGRLQVLPVSVVLVTPRNVVPPGLVTVQKKEKNKLGSSSSVETVYSGATQLSEKAQHLSDKNLAAYIFNH
jgi:hypothetical protein